MGMLRESVKRSASVRSRPNPQLTHIGATDLHGRATAGHQDELHGPLER
jgi:hypothetical protein